MRDTARILATMIIWVALLILLGGLLFMPTGVIARGNSATILHIVDYYFSASQHAIARASSATILGIVVALGMMAAMITAVVWQGGTTPRRADDRALGGKRKRLQGDRVARLLDELSDEEVYELEALLLHEARAKRDADRSRWGDL